MSSQSRAEAITVFLREVSIVQYIAMIAATLIIHDYCITIDKEMKVKYFWKRPRSFVDFVFYINRYFGIVAAISLPLQNSFSAYTSLCRSVNWCFNISQAFTVVTVDYILVIRVLAFWAQNKRLAVFLKTLVAAEAIMKFTVVFMEVIERNAQTFASVLIPGVVVCVEEASTFRDSWKITLADWVFVSASGLLFMILALHKAKEFWMISAGFRGFLLVKVLIRDQAIYYLLVVSCGILSILNHVLPLTDLYTVATLAGLGNASIVLLSLLGGRLIYNLKEAAEIGVHEGTTYRQEERLSDMEFI